MSVPEYYQQANTWPHLFVPTNETREVAENRVAKKHYCRHCHGIWWDNTPRPVGSCRARNDKDEIRRLKFNG